MSFFDQFQLLQSGYSGPEERDIPIDLSWKSVPDWLVDCRLTTRNCIERYALYHVIEKSLDLFSELPGNNAKCIAHPAIQDFYSKLTEKRSLVPWIYSYFDFKRLFDLLIEHSGEPKSKTLLGNFTSPLLHSWDQVASRWSKANLHIAHAAATLFQVLKSELPSLQASRERNSKILQLLYAKSAELSSSILLEIAAYEQLCAKYNITPPSMQEELGTSELECRLIRDLRTALRINLPQDASMIVEGFQSSGKLQAAIKYFESWTKCVIGQSQHFSMPALQQMLQEGTKFLLPDDLYANSPNNTLEKDIGNDENDAIDWGDFLIDTSTASCDLIDASSHATEHSKSPLQIVMEELDRLLAFLKQRQSELATHNDFIDLVLGRSRAAFSEDVHSSDNQDTIAAYIIEVQTARTELDTISVRHALLHSDSRIHDLAASVLQKRSKVIQLMRSRQILEAKREEQILLISQTSARINLAQQAVIDLQTSLQSAISAACGGRVVTISVPNAKIE